MRTLALSLGIALAGCSGGSNEDDVKAKAELADKLVNCNNELSNLKAELASTKAALAEAQKAASAVVKLDPVDVPGGKPNPGVKHMEGNVSPDAVVKVVRQNSGGLRACYEHALKRKPDLQYVASVTAHFSIRNSGAALGVSFTPHTDQEMERCMAQTMEKWKFPTFQGDPVAFEQPVNLVAK
jgi:hypothetical protein